MRQVVAVTLTLAAHAGKETLQRAGHIGNFSAWVSERVMEELARRQLTPQAPPVNGSNEPEAPKPTHLKPPMSMRRFQRPLPTTTEE